MKAEREGTSTTGKTFILSHILLIPKLKQKMFFVSYRRGFDRKWKKKSFNTICERIDFGRTFATETCRRNFSFIASSQAFVNRKNKDCQHLHRITPKAAKLFLSILFGIILNHRDNKLREPYETNLKIIWKGFYAKNILHLVSSIQLYVAIACSIEQD